jgi:hypothetical protein
VVRQTLIAMVLAAGGTLLAPAASAATEGKAAAVPAKVAETRAALRDLWSEHNFWVRNVALETTQKQPEAAKAAEAQVVANARQLADSIAPFYGKPAADQLFELLKGHYGPIRQYLDAGDTAGREKASKALRANAGEIAKFLSGANPNLPYDAVNGLLIAHGGHHTAQIDQLKAGQFSQEAETWAAMRKHMNLISDAIADAIAKQFPQKFA